MTRYIASPCRNFCILGSLEINDPFDGRAKHALCTFVSGGTGVLILLDAQNNSAESYILPDDNGAWALYETSGKLLIGCCAENGSLHVFDLRTRKFTGTHNAEGEFYIWNLAGGPDGMVYGGTYPGCALLRYDPKKDILENLGRVDDNGGNLYSRNVYCGDDGRLMIVCGYDKPCVVFYDIYKNEKCGVLYGGFSAMSDDAVCLEKDGEKTWYSRKTLKKVGSLEISDAKEPDFSIKGQEYLYRGEYRRIPAEAPSTGILKLACAENGIIWGSSTFGQTIFSLEPDTGIFDNTTAVCSAGGEVYGICEKDGLILMSSYSAGDHIIYDPEKPWNQRGNINPRTAASLSPEYIRPHSGSVIGCDGNMWTGWMAGYGRRGGALSRFNPATGDVSVFESPITGQAVSLICAGEKYIYFISCTQANGLAPLDAKPALAGLDTDGNAVFNAGDAPDGASDMCCADGKLYVAAGESLYVYNQENDTAAPEVIKMPCGVTALQINPKNGTLLAAGDNRLYEISYDGAVLRSIDTGFEINAARLAVSNDGRIFAACSMDVYEIEF